MAVVANGAPTDDEYDLRAAWEKACRSFAATTKVDLLEGKPQTPEEVIAQLKLKRQEDEEKKAQFKVLKDVLGKSLVFIQNLGGIAAQGAGMVFGPSELCFNAVSYLISAGQNYRNIFASLTQLFRQVSDVLERFVVYLKMKEIDKPMRKIIHQILLSFVSICELSVHVLQGNKVLKFLRVFAFNEDDGVNGAIANLRALVERESQMKTTLTYQLVKEGFGETKDAVSGVKVTLDKISEETRKREADSIDRKLFEKIKTKLDVQKDADEQIKIHRQLLSQIVPGTGKWTQENINLIEWTDRSSPYDKVLLISANEGYGKSFLITSIVHDLEKRYAQQTADTSRTTIAYFYVEQQQDTKDTSLSMQGTHSITKVLKTTALQLAQEPVYRKDLASACENWIEPDNPEELFVRLFTPCLRSRETFYFVLDGVDQMGDRSVKALFQLLKAMQTQNTPDQITRLRILLSGRTQILKDFTEAVDLRTETIDLASNNRPDLEDFITDRLERMDILQGSSAQVQNLRQEIFANLSEGANGDFINVDLLLKEIGTKRWPAEIREVLANKTQRSDTIAREIKRCNQTLHPRDIRDLNTLLTWVMSSKRTLTVGELEAVLFLKNRETPLRPLYDQIRSQYSAFFNVDRANQLEHKNALVTMVSDSISEYFRNLGHSEQQEASSYKGKIHPSEVKIIRHFLEKVCEEDLYDKFGFEEFFQHKMSSNASFVHVDLDNAHLNVLLGCFQAIARSSEADVLCLHDYACTFFVNHLQEIELATSSPGDKAQVGQYLVDMFAAKETIAKWWTPMKQSSLGPGWFYVQDKVDIVLGWLKDSAVVKKCSNADQDWVNTLTSNSFPEADLLEHICTYLSECLFRSPVVLGGDPPTLVRILHAFLNKLRRRKNPSKPIMKINMATKPITAKQINNISQWAAERLHVVKLDYEWIRCIARAYRQFGHYEEAIETFQTAAGLKEDHWFSDFGLANTYQELNDWDRAIPLYEDIRRRIEEGEAKEPSPEQYTTKLRLSLAYAYAQSSRYDKAISLYEQQLASAPDDYDTVFQKIMALGRQEHHLQVIEFLQQLQTEKDPAQGISRLSLTFHENVFERDFHSAIIVAGKRTDSLSFIKSAYQAAIEEAMDPGYLSDEESAKAQYRVMLTCQLAEMLYKNPHDSEDREEAINLWENCIADAVDIDFSLPRYAAGKSLSPVYYEKLCEGSPGSEETTQTINKLLQLSVASNDFSESDAYASTLDTRLIVGRYYTKVGMDKEAKDCLRSHVKVGVDLLSDEDPSNDWQGYLRLGMALMYYGDDDNSLAAWSLIGPNDFNVQEEIDGVDDTNETTIAEPPAADQEEEGSHQNCTANGTSTLEDSDKQDSPTPLTRSSTVRNSEGPLDYGCDGGSCDHGWTYGNNIWICRCCLDVMFATPCYELLRRDALEVKRCSPTHEFLHVPAWDQREADERGPTQVRRGGKTVPVSEWIKEIRRHWQLENN
ncbi:uncharacterized protein Z518_07780 [Rhinocladiella mackenziei CBS 650.93]|uniref:Fungal STAND N-terminal Goodbye domain-containing protein n=1 Tax=Rhinocladiella mackenziei CBS 650.93 TaxID=1442369 RepID=A0A0D2IM27_9EURO|nr:uncharacterized protein Z518_07780 [Rhinocladiella mackenziei CBS 650.93]KIX04226.1 hypothetical protein Z518_07780 [Rhinocladiella mackenziei CBS 650.93]